LGKSMHESTIGCQARFQMLCQNVDPSPRARSRETLKEAAPKGDGARTLTLASARASSRSHVAPSDLRALFHLSHLSHLSHKALVIGPNKYLAATIPMHHLPAVHDMAPASPSTGVMRSCFSYHTEPCRQRLRSHSSFSQRPHINVARDVPGLVYRPLIHPYTHEADTARSGEHRSTHLNPANTLSDSKHQS
jgi:hypothetical protein